MEHVGAINRGTFVWGNVAESRALPQRRPHADTLLRNHLDGDGARAVAIDANVTKLSADWRTAIVRLALVGGISGHAFAAGMAMNVVIVAMAAMVLWRLGRDEGTFPRVLAVGIAVGGLGYALIQKGGF